MQTNKPHPVVFPPPPPPPSSPQPQVVGPQAASRLLLTGDLVDGPEAVRLGLVLSSADATDGMGSGEAALAESMDLARRISAAAPLATRTCVRSLRMKQEEGMDKALWREADAQAQTYISSDLAEGVSATAEKRAPVFSNRENYRN